MSGVVVAGIGAAGVGRHGGSTGAAIRPVSPCRPPEPNVRQGAVFPARPATSGTCATAIRSILPDSRTRVLSRAKTFDATRHRVIRGAQKYHQIQFGRRVMFGKSEDVVVTSA